MTDGEISNFIRHTPAEAMRTIRVLAMGIVSERVTSCAFDMRPFLGRSSLIEAIESHKAVNAAIEMILPKGGSGDGSGDGNG